MTLWKDEMPVRPEGGEIDLTIASRHPDQTVELEREYRLVPTDGDIDLPKASAFAWLYVISGTATVRADSQSLDVAEFERVTISGSTSASVRATSSHLQFIFRAVGGAPAL
jgi:hypothetical protein